MGWQRVGHDWPTNTFTFNVPENRCVWVWTLVSFIEQRGSGELKWKSKKLLRVLPGSAWLQEEVSAFVSPGSSLHNWESQFVPPGNLPVTWTCLAKRSNCINQFFAIDLLIYISCQFCFSSWNLTHAWGYSWFPSCQIQQQILRSHLSCQQNLMQWSFPHLGGTLFTGFPSSSNGLLVTAQFHAMLPLHLSLFFFFNFKSR